MQAAALEQLHPAEVLKHFLAHHHVRLDGRQATDVRELQVRKGMLRNCSGSSMVVAGCARFIAGVTCEIAAPLPTAPKSGRVVVSVELPKACGVHLGRDTADEVTEMTSQLSMAVTQVFASPDIIDLTQLCIQEGSAVWILYVNVICLEYDGNPMDWAVRAAAAALEDTVIPSVEWSKRDDWWRLANPAALADPGPAVPGPDREEAERLVSSMEDAKCSMKSAEHPVKLLAQPYCVTFQRVADDDCWLADPSAREEALGDSVTVWKAGGPLHVLCAGSTGAPLDIKKVLGTGFLEMSHTTFEAIKQAVEDASKGTGELWELHTQTSENDDDDGDSLSSPRSNP